MVLRTYLIDYRKHLRKIDSLQPIFKPFELLYNITLARYGEALVCIAIE